MKLAEIAERINKHLKRFEADPVINAPSPTWKTRPYYYAGAGTAGRYVEIIYITYQHHPKLTKDEAIAYLAWLDAGNIGTHYEAKKNIANPNARVIVREE